jgi:hypothetical protein
MKRGLTGDGSSSPLTSLSENVHRCLIRASACTVAGEPLPERSGNRLELDAASG